MKFFFFISLTLIAITSECQINNVIAQRYFNEGLREFNLKNYFKADSLFNLSIILEPNIDAIYYRNIEKFDLLKICKKCTKYKINYLCGDEKYKEIYKTHCIVEDSIIYKDISNADTTYNCHLTIKICSSQKQVSYYFSKKIKNKIESSFYIEGDTSEKTNPIAKYPNLSKKLSENIIYLFTNDMPEFYGGPSTLNFFIHKNLRPPGENDFVNNVISGNVLVSFIIDDQGKVGASRIEMGMGKYCNDESLRIVNLLPNWKPGTINGKPAKFRIFYPITFSLRWVSL